MPSVTMFADFKPFESEYQANIVPGLAGIGTSGTLGALSEMTSIYIMLEK